jgi:hypothetical protein
MPSSINKTHIKLAITLTALAAAAFILWRSLSPNDIPAAASIEEQKHQEELRQHHPPPSQPASIPGAQPG